MEKSIRKYTNQQKVQEHIGEYYNRSNLIENYHQELSVKLHLIIKIRERIFEELSFFSHEFRSILWKIEKLNKIA